MKNSDWLDEKMAEGMDVSRINMPSEMSCDQVPGESDEIQESYADHLWPPTNHNT